MEIIIYKTPQHWNIVRREFGMARDDLGLAAGYLVFDAAIPPQTDLQIYTRETGWKWWRDAS